MTQRQGWRWFLLDKAKLAFVVATLPTLAWPLATLHWGLDVATSFFPQYLFAGVVFAVLFGIGRLPRWAAAAVLVGVLQAVIVTTPWRPDTAGPDADAVRLKVVVANVLTSNPNKDAFVRFVSEERPDVLVVLEVDRAWAAAIDRLETPFAGRVVVARNDNFGFAVLTRDPIVRSTAVDPADAVAWLEQEDRVVAVDVDLSGVGPVRVVAAHPLPPVGTAKWTQRNAFLANVAEAVAASELPTVVAGDFNVAPWSPFFGRLLADGGLIDSRSVRPWWDLQCSWPTHFVPLRTPIDHVLHTPGVATASRRVGPDIGSDHFPVIAELAFRRRSAERQPE